MRLEEILTRDRAAVFFHARWSGPSVVALRVLREKMKIHGVSEREIEMVDVDDEGAPIARLMDAGFQFHGGGEAVVVRAGRIHYFSVLFADPDSMSQRVDSFLDEHKKA
ncbi:MAG: hypothetical protein V4773_11600 [Verrucomicrobiota bacterium]